MYKGDFLLLACVLVLAFLFKGDPDIWDMLHKAAIERLK